jgi:glucose/arabinose dehydrogenase
MLKTSRLLAGTALSVALLVTPALAQTDATSPEAPVEGSAPAEGDAVPAGEPVETQPANAPDQVPAFPGQTRAPQPADLVETTSEVVAEGLPQLWAMEFLPDGRMLVTAKQGTLHIVGEDGELGPEIPGVPEVDARGQGGLLDVALASDFDSSGRIFLSYAEPRDGGNGTAVASATLALDDAGGGTLEDVSVIFQQQPTYDGDKHFGSRIVPTDDGSLYITVGERSDEVTRVQAQELASGFGKVFHVDLDGQPMADNPFADTEGALPEIWSLGHRNVQAAALDGDGRLWLVEHGARGGDELNRPEPGLNYGWPDVAYGIEYSGEAIGEGITADADTQQPVYYWDPVIAPSGMAWYEGEEFPEWNGAFLIGGLVATGIVVTHLEGDRVAFEERVPLDARIRDVRVGPDGAVYAVTEDPEAGTSTIVRVTRAD